jgi:uncharacterized protein
VKAALVGVIHLAPLPGSPRSAEPVSAIARQCEADAKILASAGYDAVVVENFGDTPFFRGAVAPVTVSAMTACALAIRAAAPELSVAVNVLRNDALAALCIAHVVGARAIRVNVHTGARVTDQGVIEARADETLRERRNLGAGKVEIWADVDVKHSAPLATRPLEQEVTDTCERAMADRILVTGDGTGKGVDLGRLARVKAASTRPVLVASGATLESLAALGAHADGVIVGSALREDGRAGGPIHEKRAKEFAAAFRDAFGRS